MPALLTLAFLQATPAAPAVTANTHWGLTTGEWITIAAIILGPIFAVVTQLWWQHYKQQRDQKLWVFSTLMGLRGVMLNPDFVKALNFIDVVFYENGRIRAKWKALNSYFNSDAYKPENFTPMTHEKARDLLAELLAEIGADLGYKFDYTHIKDNSYYPRFFGVADEEAAKLRQHLIAALEGKGTLSVKLVEDAPASGHESWAKFSEKKLR